MNHTLKLTMSLSIDMHTLYYNRSFSRVFQGTDVQSHKNQSAESSKKYKNVQSQKH